MTLIYVFLEIFVKTIILTITNFKVSNDFITIFFTTIITKSSSVIIILLLVCCGYSIRKIKKLSTFSEGLFHCLIAIATFMLFCNYILGLITTFKILFHSSDFETINLLYFIINVFMLITLFVFLPVSRLFRIQCRFLKETFGEKEIKIEAAVIKNDVSDASVKENVKKSESNNESKNAGAENENKK